MGKWFWALIGLASVTAAAVGFERPASASQGTESDATVVLEAFVDLELDAMGSLLDAMSASSGRAGRRAGSDATAKLDEARAAKSEAQKLHAAGKSEEAAQTLTTAFRTVSPAVKSWSTHATPDQRRVVANDLINAVGGTLTTVDKHMSSLPDEVKAHYTSAKSIHTEAKGMVGSDPQGAWSHEVDAIRELNSLVLALKVHKGH